MGPRADAAAADGDTTAQEAIEQAEEAGDDLNIIPESFMPAAEIQRKKSGKKRSAGIGRAKSVLQPPEKLNGMFTAPERSEYGWYQHPDDSMVSLSVLVGSSSHEGRRIPLHPRDSFDSFLSAYTAGNSVYMPRRVESLMSDEDRRKYEMAQASQLNFSGHLSSPPSGQVYEYSDAELQEAGFTDSVESQAGRLTHRRVASNDYGRSRSPSPDRPAASPGDPALSARPPPVAPASARTGRTGRSPLERASFIRASTLDEIEREIEDSHSTPAGRGRSPPPDRDFDKRRQ